MPKTPCRVLIGSIAPATVIIVAAAASGCAGAKTEVPPAVPATAAPLVSLPQASQTPRPSVPVAPTGPPESGSIPSPGWPPERAMAGAATWPPNAGSMQLPTWPPSPDQIPGGVDPADLLLRLADLPHGYVLGNDSGCGPFISTEGAVPELDELLYRRWPAWCGRDLEDYSSSRPANRAPLVQSMVLIFADSEQAGLFLERGALLLEGIGSVGRGPWEELAAPATLGDATRLLHTATAYVATTDITDAFALLWQRANLLSIVLVAGLGGEAGQLSALAYATVQDSRQLTPATAAARENDDLEVPLDRPDLGVPVYWLGRTFAPSNGLPSIELTGVWGPIRPGGGPGWNVELEYTAGVKIGIWQPSRWEAFKATDFGHAVWDLPCAEVTEITIPGGRAVIYGGHVGQLTPGPPPAPQVVPPGSVLATPAPGPAAGSGSQRLPLPDSYALPDPAHCPDFPPDRYLAHVYLADAVVTVNIPFAWPSIVRWTRGPDPYNSRQGMEAVARGLVRR